MYVVGIHHNHFRKVVLMIAQMIYYEEIWKIIPKLS